MPRRPRRELTDGYYHATQRGTGRIAIAHDDTDFNALATLLRIVARRWSWQLWSWCLMPNHYHVVLDTSVPCLSKGMHALNGRHARRFNDRHLRDGHLFQERFGARIIESEEELRKVCDYVIANPVRAGLVDHVEDWPWSAAYPLRR